MCTLIVLHRCTPEAPLVIAANRDEYLDRPAEGPALRRSGPVPFAAPRDLRMGGTWLGVNGAGLFAAVTNRPARERDDSRLSRGGVVVDALASRSAGEAVERLRLLPRDAYNPFNLVVADGSRAFALVYEGRPEVLPLEPGAHVVGNADPDDRRVEKVARLLARAEAAAAVSAGKRLDALAGICRAHEHTGSPLADACIHAGGYGTRSSTLLRLGKGSAPEWRYAEGPPCRTPYEDFTFLLSELDRGEEPRAGGKMERSTH